jgi:hypothetical protein
MIVSESRRSVASPASWSGWAADIPRCEFPDRSRASIATGLAVVRHMAGAWPDHEIAACLNRLRLHTGVGNTWTASRVLSLRKRLNLVDYDETAAKPMLTLYQAADRLGVGPWVVRQLIRRGLLDATQVVRCAPWQIDPAMLDADAVRRAATAWRDGRLAHEVESPILRRSEIPGI